jgi:hypothetical protein
VAAAPTTVKILSNAKRANIYIGSKRIGQPGQRIKMRPGSVVVTLKAKGYQAKSFRLNLAKSVENKFILNLAAEPDPRVAHAKTKKRLTSQPEDLFEPESPPPTDPPSALASQPDQSEANFAYQPPVPPPPQYSHRGRESSSSSSGDHPIWIALLPFGAGQYYNGSTMLGLFFTAGQIGSIYFYMVSIDAANQAVANLDEFEQRPADQATDEQKAQFREETESFVKTQKTNTNIAMASFVGLWAVGTIESYLTMTSPSKLSLFGPEINLNPGEKLDGLYYQPFVKRAPTFNTMPLLEPGKQPGFMLSVNIPF